MLFIINPKEKSFFRIETLLKHNPTNSAILKLSLDKRLKLRFGSDTLGLKNR